MSADHIDTSPEAIAIALLAEENAALRAQYETAAQRAETLEAMVAAAFEIAAECCDEADSLELAMHGANKIAERIRALTPHDAAAALAARDARMRNEGRRQSATIAASQLCLNEHYQLNGIAAKWVEGFKSCRAEIRDRIHLSLEQEDV